MAKETKKRRKEFFVEQHSCYIDDGSPGSHSPEA